MRRVRALLPGAVTVVLIVIAAAALEQLRRPSDFPPFVMTIVDWTSQRGYVNGTYTEGSYTYRLEYQARDDWTMTVVGDSTIAGIPDLGGSRCDHGTYETFDARGHVTGQLREPPGCNGVGRWIHRGLAEHWGWPRIVQDGRAIYTLDGERVVFDLTTGLPVLYEAGLSGASVGTWTVFRLERYGP